MRYLILYSPEADEILEAYLYYGIWQIQSRYYKVGTAVGLKNSGLIIIGEI